MVGPLHPANQEGDTKAIGLPLGTDLSVKAGTGSSRKVALRW